MTPQVHVCIPVLRRYDLLRELLVSLKNSEVAPKAIHIINNGRDAQRLDMALMDASFTVHVHTPQEALGLAESWNWFVMNVPEDRIITNDDIRFYPESLGAFCAGEGDLVFAHHGYSCFLVRDSCIEKVGLFDEMISPGYAYYEDCDYAQRMAAAAGDAVQVAVECRLDHGGSRTIAAATPQEIQEHHRRFMIAQQNYIKKWGPLPS